MHKNLEQFIQDDDFVEELVTHIDNYITKEIFKWVVILLIVCSPPLYFFLLQVVDY
ncbi:MAG: hypothetical protein LiPW30_789 [Parcubacteria group bacterium LiPW_30]|nr:MAG: hypothetical protein LiPW30_789 [Parcubacteria group bacterium LiPW_30]